ncbi:hypothetical protein A2V47_05250 [Candidatus Atribacteria bacterium RBG_19FT_COMBO_35_14]|uniref:Uncharacterized protein n=1 Tax=Candidatus Sediminicultor quintus TaxID=1797291 RepID=A0A1F5A7C5_9BACT|nr:MAG: hypothetical protein A2V47_05250 [Candidatus Atribacteria bacterium RBG_19FT_COMBO_35_14]
MQIKIYLYLKQCKVEARIIISKDEELKFILKGISAEAKRWHKIFSAGLIANNYKTVIKSFLGFGWSAALR